MNGQCCFRNFDKPCQPPAGVKTCCSAGECVNVRGKCALHCGCAQHGHRSAA